MEKYQTGGRRFFAGIVDALIFIPFAWFDFLILAPDKPALLMLIWLVISYPASWLYSVLLHGFYGQTIGKRVCGVKVVDNATEAPISMRQAFMRDIVVVVLNTALLAISFYLILSGRSTEASSFTTTQAVIVIAAFGWSAAEIITWLTNKKRRALHDFIAGTVVIKIEATTS